MDGGNVGRTARHFRIGLKLFLPDTFDLILQRRTARHFRIGLKPLFVVGAMWVIVASHGTSFPHRIETAAAIGRAVEFGVARHVISASD